MNEKQLDELARMIKDFILGDSYDATVFNKLGQLIGNEGIAKHLLNRIKSEMYNPEVISRKVEK